MKKLLLSFFSLILLGTSGVWGATRGKYTLDKTTTAIASENGWESGKKDLFNLNADLKYTGFSDNATLQNPAYGQATGVKGARVYESRNSVASTISGTNVWIDSVQFLYSTSTTGVLCSSRDTVGGVVPGSSGTIYNTGTPYKVDAASFSFYSGRTSSKKSNGRCDIYNWKVVYYKLPTKIDLAESMTVAVGDTFQIGQVTPTDAYYVWSSGDASKIKVDQNGVIIALATTSSPVEIKVVSKNNIEKKCNVTVVAGGGKTWQETFSKAGWFSSNTTKDVDGDSAVYNWVFTSVMREDKSGYKVDGKQGIYLRYNKTTNGASVASRGVLEGGIKAVAFKWKPATNTNEVHFVVNVDGQNYEYYTAAQTSTWYKYQREFGVEKNASFSISLDKQRTPQQAYEYFGPVTITPYLLYTNKDTTVYMKDGKYTNQGLINNGATPEYSISCGADTAEINTSTGEITIHKSAIVTVTATWGNVSTTYRLTMHAKQAPTITFADQVVDMNHVPFAPTPTEAPAGIGTPSYSSTDKSVVKVNATMGELTIVGQGYATINVHYTEGSEYAAADVSYKVTVTDPVGEGFVEEKFTTDKITSKATPDTIYGNVAAWKYKYIRRDITQTTRPDTLRCGQRASRLQDVGGTYDESYLLTTEPLEGGIKRVSFLWNNGSPFTSRDHNFIVIAGEDKDTVIKTIIAPDKDIALAAKDTIYNHNFLIKQNVTLSIRNNSGCYALIGNVKVTPYLLYTKKADTINVLDYKDVPYINKDTIDNTDGGEITYSILTENASDIATINTSTGELTIKGGGTITVQAAWNDNKVKTTYTLVINKAEYTPAFAKTEEAKTMNDSAFTNALNGVPEDATGARTYSSSNDRVAKVNNEGKVTIYGPGTADINVEIAADGVYKKASAKFALTVTEPTTDTYITEGFTGLTWGLTSADPLDGDLGIWTTYYTRRQNTSDSIMSKDKKVGAEWMSGSEKGYLVSNAAIEGGVKRIYMTWVKTAPTKEQESKFLVQVGEVKDTFDCKQVTTGTYLHNFNIQENSIIKVANASTNNFRAGPIVITPYIYYIKRADTIMASEYVFPKAYSQEVLNNTNGVGTITYESDNTDVAEALPSGNVKIKAAAADPVTITAKWQPDPDVEKYVTTSFKLYITDKKQREAEFDEPSVTVTRGDTPVNALDLQSPKGDTEPEIVYESSDTEVAVIGENNVVATVGPGTTTITAHIGETQKCLPQDVSYTLTVTYSPGTGTYFTEYFPGTESATSYQTGPDTITGTDGLYKWGLKRYRRSSSDKVGGQQGIRICYDEKKHNAYLATIGAQEGGVKEVVFDYSVPGNADNPIHFYVQVGDSIHNFRHAPITTGGVAYPYAHDFSQKSNVKLSIMMDILENPAQAAINVAPVKIIPYLLYTRKDTIVYAKDLAAKNYKFFNNKWYNNIKEGTVSYSVKAKDNAVVMDGDSVKIIGEGTDTIQASWEGVTTTYVIHVVLETPVLSFDDQEVNKKISESPYTQEVTLTTPATGTIVYSIVDDPEGASINSETGEVTMTAAGVYTIKATFPQQLPYKQGEATYQLTVTEKTVPQISFADANVDKDLLDAAFTNTLNAPEGVGAITYVSSNEDVATVDANGLVSMAKTTGSAIITAYAAENEEYAADSAKFTLNVTYTPVAGKVWKETFSLRNPQKSKDGGDIATTGDSAVYSWVLNNYDYNNNDNFDGVIGVRVRYDGFMATNNMEGGIKALAFDWRASNNTNYIHYTVKVGEETTVFDSDPIPGTVTNRFTFARKYEQKSNTSFKFTIDTAGLTNTVAFLGVSPITIVPYLLFTATNHQVSLDLDQVQQFDLNTVLINNTGADATFAVDSFKTDVAPTINAGVADFTNVKKGGKVYISATWAENPGVKTTLVINTTIKPEVSFAVPTPAAQNLVDGSYTNVLNAPEGVGAITYSSSNKQVATVDNNGVVTFLVAGTTTIKAKVAASDIYNKTEKSYDLTINGYTPVAGEAWVETFSRLSATKTYVTTEAKFQGDSAVYGWKINDYTRDSKDKPFRLRENGYIATNGRQEGGIKYAALNWKPSANGNIDFTMKVNNDSYQYKGTVTKDQPYRFEHFFNADSIVPLEIKMASDGITAYMSVVDVTVVPYLLYTKKSKTISLGETFTNTDMIDNRGVGAADIEYSITKGETLADINTATGEVTAKGAGEVTVRATWGKVWTSYKLTITSDSEITLKDSEDNSQRIELYAGVENMTVHINRTFQAGTYNTISLPFATNKTDLATALGREITSLAKYNQSATLDDEKKNLDVEIKEVEDDEEMPAGTPYLLQFSGENVTNITFDGVTIVNTTGLEVGQGGTTQFIGTINPYMVSKDAKSVLFVVAGNKLAWNATGVDKPMNGFRAYFNVPGMTDQSGVAARLVMNQPTELMNVNVNANANRKMIIDNQLIIIREGKQYNAQGQIIR